MVLLTTVLVQVLSEAQAVGLSHWHRYNLVMIDSFEVIVLIQEQIGQAQDEMMGTKEKFWFQHSQLGRCLFKYPRQNTGEDWSEKFAFELCQLLDLPSARYELAEIAEGNKGIISINFLSQDETLVHGNEVLNAIIPNYPTSATYDARQHTLSTFMAAIRDYSISFPPSWTVPSSFTDARDLFVGYLLLDAWIGNSDRHHENWGFVRPQSALPSIYLAPSYDHASCLGRELTDTKRQSRSLESYVRKCRSAFYENESREKPLKTLELFQCVVNQYPKASQEWLARLEQVSEQQIDLLIQRFPPNRLSKAAGDFAKKILLYNQAQLLSL